MTSLDPILDDWADDTRRRTGDLAASGGGAADNEIRSELARRAATACTVVRASTDRAAEAIAAPRMHQLLALAAADLLEPEAVVALLDSYVDPGFVVWYRPVDVDALRAAIHTVLEHEQPDRRLAALTGLSHRGMSEIVFDRPTDLVLAPEFLTWVVRESHDVVLRGEAASSRGVPRDLQRELVNDAQYSVLGSLAANPELDPTVQLQLADVFDDLVAHALSARMDLTRATQLRLAENPHARTWLAANPTLLESVQHRIAAMLEASDDPALRRALLRNPALIPDLQNHFTEDGAGRPDLARNPRLTAELQATFIADPDLHPDLAANPGLDESHQLTLAVTGDMALLRTLAGNSGIGERVQEFLLVYGEPTVLAALAANPGIGEQVQLALARNADLAAVLAGNPCASPGAQLQLAGHEDDEVRIALAFNDAIVAPVQDLLARDDDVRVRAVLAGNPAVKSVLAQERLAHDPEERVVTALRHNPALRADIDLVPANTRAAYRRAVETEPVAVDRAITCRIITDLGRAVATLEATGLQSLRGTPTAAMFSPEISERTRKVVNTMTPKSADGLPAQHPILSA